MKKIILIILLLSPLLLSAKTLKSMSADYDVEFGIFGKIGSAHCELIVEKGTYKISVDVKSMGLAKFLSRDRHEVYESAGLIKDDILIPDLFVKNRKWGSKEISKKYFIDHKDKKVSVLRTNSNGDIKKEQLAYFSDNDILTLFFNLDHKVKDKRTLDEGVKLTAIGANKKDGHIDIKKPNKKEMAVIKELLKNVSNPLLVTLNQKIFSSKNGEFMISIDEHGVCDKFVLKDVLLYGDLKGKIKNLNIKE